MNFPTFTPVEVDALVARRSERPAVVIATPNYEERSIGFLRDFLGRCGSASVDPSRVFVTLLWPHGNAKVDLLEQLKALYMDNLSKLLDAFENETITFSYPTDFNERIVVDVLSRSATRFQDEPVDIVVDISCMPRRVLVALCCAIAEIIERDEKRRISVLFCYTSPQRYPAPRYAQNVGGVYGYFSGRPIHASTAKHVSTLVFPSLQGYEAHVLFDEVRSHVSSSITVFVAVGGHDYHVSLAMMRANQFIMERKEVQFIYYFSVLDGIQKLAAKISEESRRLASERSAAVLVAPFGPKIYTLSAFFQLNAERARGAGCDFDIAHVSGFQYLSVYSLGVGRSLLFQVDAS